jgi:hypothetical protein
MALNKAFNKFQIGSRSQAPIYCTAVLRIRIWDPMLFYPLYPGSGSGMNFFRITDLFYYDLDFAPEKSKFALHF